MKRRRINKLIARYTRLIYVHQQWSSLQRPFSVCTCDLCVQAEQHLVRLGNERRRGA